MHLPQNITLEIGLYNMNHKKLDSACDLWVKFDSKIIILGKKLQKNYSSILSNIIYIWTKTLLFYSIKPWLDRI